MPREEIERNRLNAALARGAYGGNPPSTQSVCPTCGSDDWRVCMSSGAPHSHGRWLSGHSQGACCPDPFHSPDTQTALRQEATRLATDPQDRRAKAEADLSDLTPDTPTEERCRDCGAESGRHYADCPRRFVVAPLDKPIRYRNEHGDFWRCANCGSTLRVGQTHTCTGPLPYGPYARLSILADALTERAEDAEAAASLAPSDPQGQVEPRDTETAYVEVLAICEACGGRVEWDQVDAHEHHKGPGHRARSMEFVEALPYLRRINDLEAQLDQAERRAEEAEAKRDSAINALNAERAVWAQIRTERAQALARAASYREGLQDAAERFDDIAARPLAGFSYEVGMKSAQQIAKSAAFEARSLLNPSSTSEDDQERFIERVKRVVVEAECVCGKRVVYEPSGWDIREIDNPEIEAWWQKHVHCQPDPPSPSSTSEGE